MKNAKLDELVFKDALEIDDLVDFSKCDLCGAVFPGFLVNSVCPHCAMNFWQREACGVLERYFLSIETLLDVFNWYYTGIRCEQSEMRGL